MREYESILLKLNLFHTKKSIIIVDKINTFPPNEMSNLRFLSTILDFRVNDHNPIKISSGVHRMNNHTVNIMSYKKINKQKTV